MTTAQLTAEIRARMASAPEKLSPIFDTLKNQWPIAEIHLRGTFLDQSSDLAKLLAIVEVYEAALEIMAQVAPGYHSDDCPCVESDASNKYCTCGCKTAQSALLAADKLAGEP